MRLDAKKLVLDMLQAAELVSEFTKARTWEQYATDRFFRSAVERQFEIVGEALTVLLRADGTTGARITE